MRIPDLKCKPLVEAILEVKWALQPLGPEGAFDPHFRLLVGRLYDRISGDYPHHEELPSAAIPDEISAHMVKHRFRVAPDDWPVAQVGPGVLTMNDTQRYTWADFLRRSETLVDKLFEAYPRREDLRITNLMLRYIDAVGLNYHEQNVLDFLSDKLKLTVSFPDKLFDERGTDSRPYHLSWHSSFRCSSPPGVVHLKISTGQRDSSPVLIWETMVQSAASDVPVMPSGFSEWITSAHEVTSHWFFTLIEGDLLRRFSGD